MFLVVVQALFLFLPAAVVNGLPIIFNKFGWWKFLAVPVDFNHKLGSDFIFGPNKTWRGLIVGALGGVFIGLLQSFFYFYYPACHWLFLFSYSFFSAAFFGFLLGFGAALGDLMKSFLKRRLHMIPGSPFIPFDQLDFVLGALVTGSFFYIPPWPHILVLIIFAPFLPFLANILAYRLKLKKSLVVNR